MATIARLADFGEFFGSRFLAGDDPSGIRGVQRDWRRIYGASARALGFESDDNHGRDYSVCFVVCHVAGIFANTLCRGGRRHVFFVVRKIASHQKVSASFAIADWIFVHDCMFF